MPHRGKPKRGQRASTTKTNKDKRKGKSSRKAKKNKGLAMIKIE